VVETEVVVDVTTHEKQGVIHGADGRSKKGVQQSLTLSLRFATIVTVMTESNPTSEASPPPSIDHKALASIVRTGDLRELSEADRVELMSSACRALGLDPFTMPFSFVNIGGRVQLYARRSATDQLARIHGLVREVIDGPKVVPVLNSAVAFAMCRLTLPSGRYETASGTVPLSHQNAGDALMTAETKAKRRGTLAILGLGMLDEMEVDVIPGAEIAEVIALKERIEREVSSVETAARVWVEVSARVEALTPVQQRRVRAVLVKASRSNADAVRAAVSARRAETKGSAA